MLQLLSVLLLFLNIYLDLVAGSGGWDADDSGWGSLDPSVGSNNTAKIDPSEPSKQELRQKRMEERRLKQKAAKEKRSAGSHLKPAGLGAIKKD